MKNPPTVAGAQQAAAKQARSLSAAALTPARLDVATRAAIGELLEQGESANTRASYQSAIRYWLAWWQLRIAAPAGLSRGFDPQQDLPLATECVLQFIADHAQRVDPKDPERRLKQELPAAVARALVRAGVKAPARRAPNSPKSTEPDARPMALNTLKHRLAAMARLHRSRKLESPTDSEEVRRLMRAVRNGYAKRGQRPKAKDPLAATQLRRLLDTCDATPLGVRDRALLLFAFASGGRRRSEVAAADLALLKADGDGYSYHLVHSKTNQAGDERPEDHKPILGEAAEALRAWIALLYARGMMNGPIFRRIRRGGHIGPEGLSDHAVWEIVKRRCALAGIAAEGAFSAHSLRAGFMTEAALQNIPLDESMAMSGHHDVKTAMGYIRKAGMKRSRAATLMDSAAD